jgi:phage terminase large subunit-like protein
VVGEGLLQHLKRGQRRVYISPRGSGKTVWCSTAYPLYGAVEGIEPLTLLMAETGEQAKKYLESIKDELIYNDEIAKDYPAAAGKGTIWQSDRIRLRNGCEILARGAGGRILGVKNRNSRPSLIVIDDGNERGDAYSPTKRERKLEWLKKDIIPVGDPSTNIVAAGTPIHAEAIVCALRAANWPARSYCALISEPTRMDLWEECGRLMTDLSDPAAGATAKAFYEANRAAMDEGAQLLWPERHGLYFYMEYRTLYGEPAYRSEYTDDPGTPEGAEWPAELFEWPGFWFHEWPTTLIAKIIALDPSKGNDAKSGDRQAHAMVGLGVDGNLYIDVDARHETPEAMCERTCYLYRDFNKTGRQVDSVVLEDNGTLGLIQVAARLAMEKTQTAGMPWSCLTQRDPKPLRIRCVSSYLYTKRIRLRNTPGSRIALKEWKEFPYSDRDDCVDAIATAIRDLEHRLSQR